MCEMDGYTLRANLAPHSNFSFEMVERERWEYSKINNSLFNGSVFFGCSFREVCFDNADLEGTRFSGCTFNNCSFTGADIHSIWVADCHFSGVTFDESIMTDCTFHGCEFLECSFNSATQMECIFDGCLLDPFTPKRSSITLNQYKDTTFRNAAFMNVFYYQWFDNCHLPKATFEAYLLGYIYGLTIENFKECHIVVMGGHQELPHDDSLSLNDIYHQIEQIYNDRRMYLNIGILELGNLQNSKDEILLKCIQLLSRLLADDQLLKNEQVKFLNKLIVSLYEEKQIVPLTIYLMEREIDKIITHYKNEEHNTAWAKAEKEIIALKNNLYFMFLEFLDQLQSLPQALPNSEEIMLRFTYEEQPQLPFSEIIAAMMPGLPAPIQIRTEKGSFIEIIQFFNNAMPYIEIFLKLLGIAVPIILAIRRERREDKKEAAAAAKESRATATELPSIYVTPGVTVIVGEKVARAAKVIVDYRIIYDGKKMGYNTKNLKEIRVIPSAKAHQDIG